MVAFRVRSAKWIKKCVNDDDPGNTFIAVYAFDDGYESLESVVNAVASLGLDTSRMRYIRVMGNWYALYMHVVSEAIVISSDYLYIDRKAYGKTSKIKHFPGMTFNRSEGYFGDMWYFAGKSKWRDGIVKDLAMTETCPENRIIAARRDGSEVPRGTVEFSNSLVRLAIPFFISEINISDMDFAAYVLSRYYAPKTFHERMEEALTLRYMDFRYYNPFTGKASASYDMSRKKIERLTGCRLEDIPIYGK